MAIGIHTVPADLLDEFAAADLPLAIHPDNPDRRIDLRTWAEQPERRDLSRLAANPALRGAFERGVDAAYAQQGPALAATAGTRVLVLAKLDQAAARTAHRPLTLVTLAEVWRELLEPVAEMDDPDIRRRIQRVRDQLDPADLLADNLRLGTRAELAWPAAEEAYAAAVTGQPPGRFDRQPSLDVSWPHLVISGPRAVLLDGETRRTLTPPAPGDTITDVTPVGEDLALEWHGPNSWERVRAWDPT